jgi:phosphoribosylanthranilate isomerase
MLEQAVQVAGVIDQREADLLIGLGVRLLGFPLRLRDGREDLDEAAARSIITSLPSDVGAVAITYLDRARDVLDLCASVGTHWVQLHGAIDIDELAALKSASPALGIIKSLIVRPGNAAVLCDELDRCAEHVDAFITDTWDPATHRTGATGHTHDWAVSRLLADRSPKPVILAGGLRPANVRAAIIAVRPAAVDVHTGVEGPDGRKDPRLVREFITASEAAFETLHGGSPES